MTRHFSWLVFFFVVVVLVSFGPPSVPLVNARSQQDVGLPEHLHESSVQDDDSIIVLTPSGLSTNSDSTPESILPAGAILHLRVNGCADLLNDISRMATPFIPERALGPPAVAALAEPNPLLALIGFQTIGEPLSVDRLAQISGIDPARPVSISFYLAPPQHGFILCLPVLDLNRPAALIQNLLPPHRFVERLELDGGFAQHVSTPDLDLFIVCSADTICLCGSPELAQQVLQSTDGQRLHHSERITYAVRANQAHNVLLAIDAQPMKPLLPLLYRFHEMPPRELAELRAEFLSQMDFETIHSINRQLRSYGIANIEQAMDYVECVVTGGYEIFFETFKKLANDFHGLVLAVDLNDEFQTLRFSLVSDGIQPTRATHPFDLAAVRQVMSSLPGPHDSLVLSGRKPMPTKWPWIENFILRVGEKMRAKDLPMEVYAHIRQAYDDYAPVTPLESKVDWTIQTSFINNVKTPAEFDSLTTYWEQSWHQFQWFTLLAIPPQDLGFLETHFEQTAAATNANRARQQNFWRQVNSLEPILTTSSNSRLESMPNGVHKLVYEDIHKSTFGWFGYNEHELINRYFTLYRDRDDHILLWPGGNLVDLFSGLEPQPTPPAVDSLIDHSSLPNQVQQLEISRNIHHFVNFVDFVDSLEELVHRELSTYLNRLQSIAGEPGSGKPPMMLIDEMAALEMPLIVTHVMAHSDTDELYLLTPLGLAFPRPRIVPAAVQLLQDFRQISDAVGGSIVHHAVHDGRYEMVVVQSTAGLSKLIRSVGNRIADEYLHHPQGQQKIRQLFHNDLDDSLESEMPLLTNEFWGFLGFSNYLEP